MRPIESSDVILKMLKVQKHRGPDDSGINAFSLFSGNTSIINSKEPSRISGACEGIVGFNRLSILDLSPLGHQPMLSPDGKVIFLLNGEVYNSFDYKGEMEKWGYQFKSKTDTEIVLALYLKYGLDKCISLLNGMFAIVIIDLRQKMVHIARDRFGIKPMYYIYSHDLFAFSSELKSFFFLDNFKFSLEENQLDEFMIFRNNIKGTLFRDINSLDPGYHLTFSYEGNLTKKKYFDINNHNRFLARGIKIDEHCQRLEQTLEESVKRQIISDVKLGCQLSGGIDSSIITWLANRIADDGQFETVSIIFNDQRYSEEQYIDHVAKSLGISSHKFNLEPDYFFENLKKATWHNEVPINHPNTIAILKLSQKAKEYVTVLLSGEGADEVFGGYPRFHDLVHPYRIKPFLHYIRRAFLEYPEISNYFDQETNAIMANSYMSPNLAKALNSKFNLERSLCNRFSIFRTLKGTTFTKQVKYEIMSYLPDLLNRQDKMSMAYSIENRVPFLDNEVIDYSFSISENLLLKRKTWRDENYEKYLLKRLVANEFGADFAFRKKRGLGIPLRNYFKNESFREYLQDEVIVGIRNRCLFKSELILSWLKNINNASYPEIEALWVMISFEIWASVFLDSGYLD